jgi:hypothetical protein
MRERLLGVAATLILCACSGNEGGPAATTQDSGVVDTSSSEVAIDAIGDAPDASRSHPVLDQSCSESSNMNACGKCSEEHCCETRGACDAECDAIFTCFNACTEGPDVCVDKCMAAHPTGAAAYAAHNACVNLYCGNPCSGKPNACRDCRLANCAYEHVACFADVDCRRYGFCYEACTDAACDAACRAKAPSAAVETYDAYESCLDKFCAGSC